MLNPDDLPHLLLKVAREPAPAWLDFKGILADWLEDRGDERHGKVRAAEGAYPEGPTPRLLRLIRDADNGEDRHGLRTARWAGWGPRHMPTNYMVALCDCVQDEVPVFRLDTPSVHPSFRQMVMRRQVFRERVVGRWGAPEPPRYHDTVFFVGRCEECDRVLWAAQVTAEEEAFRERDHRRKILALFPEVPVKREYRAGVAHCRGDDDLFRHVLREAEAVMEAEGWGAANRSPANVIACHLDEKNQQVVWRQTLAAPDLIPPEPEYGPSPLRDAYTTWDARWATDAGSIRENLEAVRRRFLDNA